MERIGFVGVGVMGHGMASCLLKAGYPLTVIAHRNREPVEDLLGRGASEADSLVALAEASDVVILCVSNSTVVEHVVGAMKPALRSGQMVIDTGTSSPDSTRRIAADLAEMDVAFVEAPVTGGVAQAAAGELGALVGADAAVFDGVKPLLSTFCRTVHHFGPPGAGNTAKLINNFMVLGMAALVIEAFAKAETAGVDWGKLYEVMICGAGDSGVLRRIAGAAVEGDFGGYVFDVDGSLKDVTYFCDLAETLDGVSPLATAIHGVYAKAVADGHGGRRLSELLSPALRGG